MKLAVLHSGYVGTQILEYLSSFGTDEIRGCDPTVWKERYDDLGTRCCPEWIADYKPDWLILAWWPIIVHPCVLVCAAHTLNVHNSLLPFCRGKHPNFWALVDEVPYGVSLHEVTPKVDAGGIYVQEEIPYDWTDTGETLHRKSLALSVDLFKRSWPKIASGRILPVQQSALGSHHNAAEIEPASRIQMGATTGREVLNVIRARQAYGHAAWFVDRGVKYEVTVNIARV